MKTFSLVFSALLITAGVGCRGDTSKAAPPPVPPPPVIDTVPQDLSGVHTSLPPAAAEPPAPAAAAETSKPTVSYPPAPDALMDAVKREESVTRFCYQEYGQKADPMLQGQVSLTVTIAENAVSNVAIAQSRWSAPDAGTQVNTCLVRRARQAWRLDPGTTVKPGNYLVQLNFRGGN